MMFTEEETIYLLGSNSSSDDEDDNIQRRKDPCLKRWKKALFRLKWPLLETIKDLTYKDASADLIGIKYAHIYLFYSLIYISTSSLLCLSIY